MSRTWTYLPALDGLRAIAVVVVVLFHFWEDTFPGGFIGVDIFFVLSGFLITGIMATEHDRSGTVDLGAFWGRRIRRLVPAVLLLVVVTSVAVAVTDSGSALHLAHALGALTWTTNLTTVFLGGELFVGTNHNTVLDHLWSLAIEEQFYVLWPLGFLVLMRWCRTDRARLGVIGAGIVASAITMGLAGPIGGYFRTDARAFELLAGAALAIGLSGRRVTPAASSALAVVGALGLAAVVALVSPSDAWLFPWGFLLITALASSLVVAAVHPAGWLRAGLCWGPVRYVGRVSYGIYLWHIPVLRILSAGRLGLEDDPLLLALVRFAVLAALVEISARLVEDPIRRGRIAFGWRQAAIGYGIALASLALVWPGVSRDWDHRFDHPIPAPVAAAGDTRVLVAGDFSAMVVGDALANTEAEPPLSVWSISDGGCSLYETSGSVRLPLIADGPDESTGYCRAWRTRWAHAAQQFEPDVAVISVGYNDAADIIVDGETLDPTAASELMEQTLREAIVALSDGWQGPDRIVVVQVLDWSELVGDRWRPEREDAQDRFTQALDAAVADDERVEVARIGPTPSWDDVRDAAASLILAG